MPVPPDEMRSEAQDLAYHRTPHTAAPLQQVDEAIAWTVRELPGQLSSGLKRNFPLASSALPASRWQQLGLAALGLLGVNWLIGLEPASAQVLLGFTGLGLAGYAGWSILRHGQRSASDAQSQRFAEHSAALSSPQPELRIAALAALDQLAYDHPRYRRPLVHLLAAWLDEKAASGTEGSAGHDCAVARQMLAEFWQMLRAEPQPPLAAPPHPATIAPTAQVEAAPPQPAEEAAPAVGRLEHEQAAALSVIEAEAVAEPDAPAELPAAETDDPGHEPSAQLGTAAEELPPPARKAASSE